MQIYGYSPKKPIFARTADQNTMSEPRKLYIETYGCQMNVNDTEVIFSILARHGYEAKGNGLFEVSKHSDETLVFFCHLGVSFAMIGYLTQIAPPALWQGFFVAPTSLTILNSEERLAGQAFFRVERLGDTNHLINGGEPISSSGYFADVFSE